MNHSMLLVTLPYNIPTQRYYPAAYVSSIITNAGWNSHYTDCNYMCWAKTDERIKSIWVNPFSLLFEKKAFETAANLFNELLPTQFANVLTSKGIDIVGVSTSEFSRPFVSLFLSFMKKNFPEIPVILGGSDCFPAFHGKNYFADQYCPDILVQGEAENVLPAILRNFEETGSVIIDEPGCVYKKSNGELVDTGVPIPTKLSSCKIVADFSIFDQKDCDYNHISVTFSSSGCINKCSFCNAWKGPHIRYRNYDTIVDEILAQQDGTPQSRSVVMRDANLNTSLRHVTELCKCIINRNLKIKWSCMGCFRVDLPVETISLMNESGLVNIMIGLESASQEVIQFMGKIYDINDAQRMIARLISNDITVQMPIISGFPGETTNDFLTTASFVLKHKTNNKTGFCFSNRCHLHHGAFINDYPDDFFIDKKTIDPGTWRTIDSSNTYDVRDLRSCLIMILMVKATHTTFNGKENIFKINFNDINVAIELARIISKLGMLNDNYAESLNVLQLNSITHDILQASPDSLDFRKAFQDTVIPNFSLADWFSADKNGEIKPIIISHMLAQFELLGEKLSLSEFVDFNEYRKSLCAISNFSDKEFISKDLTVNSVRDSEYDGGQYLIITGYIFDSANLSPPVSLLACVNSHIIEFHVYQELDNSINSSPNVHPGHFHFWGKVKKSYLGNDFIDFTLLFRDGTRASIRYDTSTLLGMHKRMIPVNLDKQLSENLAVL